MHFLPLTLLNCLLIVFLGNTPVENSRAVPAKRVEPTASNIILQSKDGGQTWQDISQGLPDKEQPEDFFAGVSDVYLRSKNVLYHSKSGLNTLVWEKEKFVDLEGASIAFNRSGIVTYNYDGHMYQQTPASGAWVPVYTTFKKQTMRTIFETSEGILLVGSDKGLYKSTDKGKTWKQVQDEGWVMDIVESEGVLIGTGQKGIMRSTDKGEHWEWVIREGGVGIAVERVQGGFAAISYSSGTSSRRIRLSMDGGKTWKAIDEGLRPSLSISSIKQVGYNLVCAHPDGIFLSTDMGKSWKRVHTGIHTNVSASFNFWSANPATENKKVFKLYVSGSTLYAVMRDFGC